MRGGGAGEGAVESTSTRAMRVVFNVPLSLNSPSKRRRWRGPLTPAAGATDRRRWATRRGAARREDRAARISRRRVEGEEKERGGDGVRCESWSRSRHLTRFFRPRTRASTQAHTLTQPTPACQYSTHTSIMSPGAAPIATAAAPKKKKGSNAAKGAPAAATAPAAKAASPAPSGAGPIASPPPGGRVAVTTSLRVAEPGPR